MKLHPRSTIARKRIEKMQHAILEAIDKICEEEKHEITYAEINRAIINVLESNNNHELRSLWEDETEEK